MIDPYGLLKFAHVAAVIVWLGGSLALAAVMGALAKEENRAIPAAFLREASFYGPIIMGPASLVTLLTGLGMALITRQFGALWVQIGFGGILVHFVMGPGLIRAATLHLEHLLSGPSVELTSLNAARRRLRNLNLIYLVVLFAVVAAMVLKPG